MRDFLTAALDIICPRTCGGCNRPGPPICGDCLDTFDPIDPGVSCPLCGRPVGIAMICGPCLSRRHHFSAGHFGFIFSDRMRDALLAFKFRGRKDVGRALVSLLTEKVKGLSARFDTIVPLPVTERRLRERGFNQTYILSEEIARITGKAIDYSSLIKKRETPDQYTLNRDQRKRNVAGAFVITGSRGIRDSRILLVDDLFTTGSTLSEAAKVLSEAGARDVQIFALARTP